VIFTVILEKMVKTRNQNTCPTPEMHFENATKELKSFSTLSQKWCQSSDVKSENKSQKNINPL
jgi:hypothetical protein